ncbi:MAG: oligoendopeptidase F, partial [Tagaea sp.]|nr:oligoendopeptidase F [Tagaea sp.]
MTQSAAKTTLPEWDLRDLFPGRDSPELEAAFAAADKDAAAFQTRLEGKLSGLDGKALGQAIADYEKLEERLSRITSYADLTYAGNQSDSAIAKFYQTVQERVNGISTRTLFFTLELNRLDDADLKAKLAAPELARYAPWLRDLRAFRPHQLEDRMEKLLHEKYVAGRAAWTRL